MVLSFFFFLFFFFGWDGELGAGPGPFYSCFRSNGQFALGVCFYAMN